MLVIILAVALAYLLIKHNYHKQAVSKANTVKSATGTSIGIVKESGVLSQIRVAYFGERPVTPEPVDQEV